MDPVTIASLALQVLGAGNSIAGGVKAKKEARDADRAAKAATAEARKNIALNQYQAMQVPIEPLQIASRGIVSGQQQLVQALQEAGQRGIIGGVGRIQAAGVQGQESQRQTTSGLLMDRDKLIAKEQAAINRRLAAMSINEALGAQERLREREMAGNKMIASGAQALGSAAVSAFKESDLFKKQDGVDLPDRQDVTSTVNEGQPEFMIPGVSEDPTAMENYIQLLAATGSLPDMYKTEY